MDRETAHTALAVIIDESAKNAADIAALRSLMAHCAVELALWQATHGPAPDWPEAERARLFAAYDAGRLCVSIGGGHAVAEVKP